MLFVIYFCVCSRFVILRSGIDAQPFRKCFTNLRMQILLISGLQPCHLPDFAHLAIFNVISGVAIENLTRFVFIKIDSDKHIDEIKNYLDAEYGPVRAQLRVTQTIYIYDYHNIKIKLKEYETKGTYKLGFYYTPLSSKLNESRLEKNAETTIQLVPKK